MQPAQTVSAKEVCQICGIHRNTLRKLRTSGAFPLPIFTSPLRWSRQQINDHLTRSGQGDQPELARQDQRPAAAV